MKFKPSLLLACAFVISSCNDNNSSPVQVPAPVNNTETTTPIITRPSSGVSAFDLAEASFNSASLFGFVSDCNEYGDTTTAVGTSAYTADKIFCSFSKSSDRPGTMRGSYFASSGVLCAINKKITFTDPVTPAVYDNIILSESDACFKGYGYDANKDGHSTDEVSISVRVSKPLESDYDQLIQIQIGEETYNKLAPNDFNIYIKNTDNLVAAKSYEATAVTEVIVYKATGTLNYESRDYASKTHIKTVLQGSMDPITGSLATIEKLQAIESLGDSGAEKYSIMYSSNGHNTRYDHFVGKVRAADYDQCVGNCTAIYQIPYKADFHNFAANPQTEYDNGKMMEQKEDLTMEF
ncbi:MAG: hypothetical protein H7336_07150 [Bacteriovorax sp.]|nr:hypothetical protein [Bacteriovorax sp.]